MLTSGGLIVPESTTGATAGGGSTRRRGAGSPEYDCGSSRVRESVVTRVGSLRAPVGSSGAGIVRLRTAGKVCTVGTFFAVVATVFIGRRRNSATSATITGVAAALMSVPAPQIREAANDATADARLAMISVCIEKPLPGRLSLRSALGPEASTTPSLVRRTLEGRGVGTRSLATGMTLNNGTAEVPR